MKIRLKFSFLLFLILFCGFIGLAPVLASTNGLEVEYPTLATGPVRTLDSNSTLPQYARYIFDFGMFVGFFAVFLGLAIAGVTYLLSGILPMTQVVKVLGIDKNFSGTRREAKDRAVGAITGLIILVTTYLIITTINPQLKFFYVEELTPIPPGPATPPPAGVYFNKSNNCSDADTQAVTSNTPDLVNLKNKINSVKFVRDPSGEPVYISVIYNTINFYGRCQYIDPNKTCNSVESFANSATVYQYDFKPDGNGVFFYRRSLYGYDPDSDSTGGYYKVDNDTIKGSGIYIKALADLQFQDVPEEEQDCVEYATTTEDTCVKRRPLDLAGENISSIDIDGNYMVLLVYKGPGDDAYGPWTWCQAYPAINDANKKGPIQIKWDAIRNNGGVIPNYVIIIPVKQK